MGNGRLTVVDGITGSGKSTILEVAREWAKDASLRIFDLKEWSQSHDAPPEFKDIADYDVYFTFEPTRTWIGSAIRFELSRTDHPYNIREIAQAFAIDRHLMYRRLIVPALEAGKIIIQDRSVTSSLIIQPLLDASLSVEEVASLPGNAFALDHAPNTLILTSVDPETAGARIQSRTDDSKGVYEQLDLLRKEADAFQSDWFHALMTSHGTKIQPIDTSLDIETTRKEAYRLFATS
jgi:thymidylate kinase